MPVQQSKTPRLSSGKAERSGEKLSYVSLGPEEEEKKGNGASQNDEELFKHLSYLS